MTTDPRSGPPELREYLAVLWRRRWYIATALAIVLAAAAFYTATVAPTYTAQAKVLVQTPQSTGGEVAPDATTDMETERELVESLTVARGVVKALDFRGDASGLLRYVTTSVSPDTQLLVISFTASDPRVARAGAQAFAEEYLAQRKARFEADIKASIVPLTSQIENLEGLREDLIQELSAATAETRQGELHANLDSLNERIGELTEQRAEAGAKTIGSVGQVADPAVAPTQPTNRHWLPTLLLAAFVGLILGIAAALVRDRLDDRPRSPEELEARSGAPTLGSLPRVDVRRGQSALVVDDPAVPPTLVDAFRSLRTSVAFALAKSDAQIILVTSPNAGDGKTTVAANLAASIAYTGEAVVLVSADLRRPGLYRLFETDRDAPGLTSVLRADLEMGNAIVPTRIPNLGVVPTGPIREGDVELLRADRLRRAFDPLRSSQGVVIIDGPPVLGVPDTLALAQAADATLLVIDASRTTRASIDRGARQLALVGVEVFGEVLNKVGGTGAEYYDAYRERDGRRPASREEQPDETPAIVETNGNGSRRHPSEYDDAPTSRGASRRSR
jgi:capsular exopolysaccharide synthesis family protein